MCRRVQCNTCKRPTFAGCGAHIEQVLGDVPKSERCRCHERAAVDESAASPGQPGQHGWLRSLFGK